MKNVNNNRTAFIIIAGSILLIALMAAGTVWLGHGARNNTRLAVRSVSLLYLDELAGRREKVVENNLQEKISTIKIAIELMTPADHSDAGHLAAYQKRMKTLFSLDKFAFVDTEGLIYTSTGPQYNIDRYAFDYKTLSGPNISLYSTEEGKRQVIVAVPVSLSLGSKPLCVCFMAIDMDKMLSGISLETNTNDATFCNLYTLDGMALTEAVLGGLASESNLLDAMKNAEYEKEFSYDSFSRSFTEGKRGVVSFTYNGIRETLCFIPVNGTDWQLTYLIRESVISARIDSISQDIVRKSFVQSLLTVAVLLVLFGLVAAQVKKNSRLVLEHNTAEAENRARQENLEKQLSLQAQLLEEQRHREELNKMVSALSSDFRGLYYIELDRDEAVCHRSHVDLEGGGCVPGERFPYTASFADYAEKYVDPEHKEEFLRFVKPENVSEALKTSAVISYTYIVRRGGKETYETVRFAAIAMPEDKDGAVTKAGACFVDSDAETRNAMRQRQTLSDALAAAEEASRAKTAFLSNMSHEIRTPMNAIIGLNSIALKDPGLPEQTRDYLGQIGASAEHLLELINDILDMSRIESGRLTLRNEEFSFARLLEAVNTMFSAQCREKGLEYQCRLNSEIDVHYIGDNMKLRQVLINILGNAVKFTPAGGRVELQIAKKAQYAGKTTLEFVISDTGVGISEEFMPKLFDSFAQEDATVSNKYGSSGLGLAITKSIVEMMNGNIAVSSVKGKGTTFTVTVTLSDDPSAASSGALKEVHPSEMTVLVIDDDATSREHAKLVLEKAGIAAELAESGAQAVEMVRLRHARREPYDLILVDWQMPEMDGVETSRRIRSVIGNQSAIIILTAYDWDDILDEAQEAGVDSFIAKPLFAASVLEEYSSALERRRDSQGKEKAAAELSGRHILLAEDMQVNAKIMSMVLKSRGMEVDLAQNGKVATELMAASPEGYYSAVLMDIRMPEMDGLEAARLIRAMDRADAKTVPIIALTANAFDEDVQRSLQAGMNAHLSKPVKPEALYETLESLIKD